MSDFDLEAEEFDRRIHDRVSQGFNPDLREMTPNEYFYKSFWRHPNYVDLHVGEMFRHYLSYLQKYCGTGCRVLDLGCGPGYFALELARNGYEVIGADISSESINAANQALDANRVTDGFGSLEYIVGSFDELKNIGTFDAVLSSGFLHHIPEIDAAVDAAAEVLNESGYLIWHEPTHARWTKTDAAFVAVIRTILSAAGLWYEKDLHHGLGSDALLNLIDEVHTEYVLERDPSEAEGQSPNDLSWDEADIIAAVGRKFSILQTEPSRSFIYRLMGGMRGDQERLNEMAALLATIDSTLVEKEILNSNYGYGVAQKRGN